MTSSAMKNFCTSRYHYTIDLIIRRKHCEKLRSLWDVRKRRDKIENDKQNNIRCASHIAIYIFNLEVILIRDTNI